MKNCGAGPWLSPECLSVLGPRDRGSLPGILSYSVLVVYRFLEQVFTILLLSPREQVPSVDAKMSGKELAFSGPWAQQMTKAEPTQYYSPLETEPYSDLMYSLGLRVCVCVCVVAQG